MDPQGPPNGEMRALRGGSWNFEPVYARVSFRYRYEPSDQKLFIGFRCAGELR